MEQNHQRRSTRLKGTKIENFVEDDDVEDGSNEDTKTTAAVSTQRARKRKRLGKEEDLEDDIYANHNSKNLKRKSEPSQRKKAAKLSLLPTMPLDVLYVIFGYLPPKSLLALIRVNKAFRTTLLASNAVTIWASTRKSCKAPEPSPGLTEVEWSQVLFGNHYCQLCGTKNVNHVDFWLRKRICCACIKRTGVSKGKFRHAYPGEDISVLELVLPVSGGRQNRHTMYYSLAELDKVLGELRACKGAAAKEQYKAERMEYLERVKNHATVCYDWERQDARVMREDSKAVKGDRIKEVKRHLLALNFSEADVKAALALHVVQISNPLTDRSWAMMKSQVIAKASEHKLIRLLANPSGVIVSRLHLVSQIYSDFKKTISPLQWRSIPQVQTVCLFPSFREVMMRPEDTQVTESDFQKAQDTLQSDIDDWITNTSDSAISHIHAGYGHGGPIEAYGLHWSDMCKIAPDNAIIQAKCPNIIATCTEAGLALVTATGVSLTETTADEMDDIGAFYSCLVCSDSYVGTWRECIKHWTKSDKVLHPVNPWRSLYDRNNRAFKMLDSKNDTWRDERLSWSCSHCIEHFENLATRADVVEHARSE
ncbi:hypothetical protein VNI00_016291 [Paramarasmius palmivorus]|uniref:F-box domain-containing protein n=1 Tax=Paramarasmius palmivorus TaxID=297713 RepID=A0AAW0BEA3_9AGAR